jgi:ABC-type spermidine/putrescine transport system permease subunit II
VTAATGRSRGLQALAPLAPFGLVVAVGVGVPAGLLAWTSIRNTGFFGFRPGITLSHFADAVEAAAFRNALSHSLVIGFVVAVLVCALSIPLAYALRFRMGRRRSLWVLGVLVASSVASYLIRILAWQTILSTNGIVNSLLRTVGLVDSRLQFLNFSSFAIVVTMVYLYLPIGALLTYAAMQGIDPRELEASRDLGMGRWRTLWLVVIPRARAGLIATLALTVILATWDYVTPSLVGGRSGQQMIGVVVRDTVLFRGDYSRGSAEAIIASATMVGAMIACAALCRLAVVILRRQRHRIHRACNRATWRGTAVASFSRPLAILLTAYLALPTIVFVVFSFNSGTTTGFPYNGLTLHWYPDAVGRAGFSSALSTSVAIAPIVCGLAVLIGVPAAFGMQRLSGRLRRAVGVTPYTPFLIPAVLLGSAIVILGSENIVTPGLRVTIFMHLLVFCPLVVLITAARLSTLDANLVPAARDLGSRPLRAFRTVTAPLLLPSVLAATLLVLAYSLDELPMTNFTIGTDATVPVWLYSQARFGLNPGVNAIGTMLLAGTLAAFAAAAAIVWRSTRPSGGTGRRG